MSETRKMARKPIMILSKRAGLGRFPPNALKPKLIARAITEPVSKMIQRDITPKVSIYSTLTVAIKNGRE
jgi:hypothetical protein